MKNSIVFPLTIVLCLLYAPYLLCQSVVPTEYWGIKPYDMWAATPPHKKLCTSNGRCYSLKVIFPDRHIRQYQDNGTYTVVAILPDGGIGVTRDFNPVEGLRCFSDSTTTCVPATFPPGYSPGYDTVPVLSNVSVNSPTPGAKLKYSLHRLQVNAINTTTCAVSWIGEVIHSGTHFVLDSYDFGPPVGVLNNIYVTEETQGCPISTTNPIFCQRIERYFFSPVLGRIRQEGWNDPACDGTTPSTCMGNYILPAPGAHQWVPSEDPPVTEVLEICP